MGLSQYFRSRDAEEPAPTETTSCSHDAAIHGLAAEIRRLTARIDGFERAFTALNSFRVALEAKTWIAFHQRRSGRVAGGCAQSRIRKARCARPLRARCPARYQCLRLA
jgi:hypothetical protein